MQRYGRIDAPDEAVINEFNSIEQIYKVSGPIRIKLRSYFQGKLFIFRANCYFQGKFFPSPQ